MLLMVMSLPVFFSSCGDDDKDSPDEGVVTEIIGTWGAIITDEDGTQIVSYTFRTNGLFTATFTEETDIFDDDNIQSVTGTYTYNQVTRFLTLNGKSDEGKVINFSVRCEISGNTMVWTEDDGTKTTFVK